MIREARWPCITISDSMDDLVATELLTSLYGRREPVSYARAEYMLSRWRMFCDKRKSDERSDEDKQNWFRSPLLLLSARRAGLARGAIVLVRDH